MIHICYSLKKACLSDCGGLVANANRLHSSISLLLLKQMMMEVVSGDNWTTGAISHAKLQSNHHHQQTNIPFFTGWMPFLLPNQQCQSTKG